MIRFKFGTGGDDTIAGDVGHNNIILGRAGNDVITGAELGDVLFGGSGDDVVNGLGGNDLLDGGIGNDTLNGGDGRDALLGGAGNDALDGGSGDDFLTGGAGADHLLGGDGKDSFVFLTIADSSLAGADTIGDFATGSDIMNLAIIDANTSARFNQAFAFGGNSADVVANSVTWFQDGANTIVQADVNGDSTADFRLVLNGLLTLSAADFIL